MARRALRRLTNADYSDREVLHILNDAANSADGWAETDDLCQMFGIVAPNDYAAAAQQAYIRRCVGARFRWMRTFGFVERADTRWRLTPEGRELMSGRLTKVIETRLASMKPGDRVLVMRHLAEFFQGSASPAAATMLRREWMHGTHRNR